MDHLVAAVLGCLAGLVVPDLLLSGHTDLTVGLWSKAREGVSRKRRELRDHRPVVDRRGLAAGRHVTLAGHLFVASCYRERQFVHWAEDHPFLWRNVARVLQEIIGLLVGNRSGVCWHCFSNLW